MSDDDEFAQVEASPEAIHSWLVRHVERFQAFPSLDGETLGLEFHVWNGEPFRVAFPAGGARPGGRRAAPQTRRVP